MDVSLYILKSMYILSPCSRNWLLSLGLVILLEHSEWHSIQGHFPLPCVLSYLLLLITSWSASRMVLHQEMCNFGLHTVCIYCLIDSICGSYNSRILVWLGILKAVIKRGIHRESQTSSIELSQGHWEVYTHIRKWTGLTHQKGGLFTVNSHQEGIQLRIRTNARTSNGLWTEVFETFIFLIQFFPFFVFQNP